MSEDVFMDSKHDSSNLLRNEVDAACLTFVALSGSGAETEGLGAESACACWNARSLVMLRATDSGPIRNRKARRRAWLRMLAVRWSGPQRFPAASTTSVQCSGAHPTWNRRYERNTRHCGSI